MRFKPVFATVLAVGIFVLAAWGFLHGHQALTSEEEHERPVTAASRLVIEAGQPAIVLDEATRFRSGIEVAALKPVSYQREIPTYGTVLALQDLIELHANYVAAKAQVEKAAASLGATRKEYDRLKTLHADDRNISDKVLQAAEAAWQADVVGVRAAQAAVTAIEYNARQAWGGPLTTAVLEGTDLFTRLLQQQEVLIQVTLPTNMYLAAAANTARIRAPDGTFQTAALVSPATRADPRLQGSSFFYRAAVPGLLSGMSVSAYLPNGAASEGVMVPTSAVIWWQGKAWVYSQEAPERYVRREISTENPTNDGWFVEAGLMPDKPVVVRGAQLLLSEEFRAQIQVGEEGMAQ